MQVVEIMEGRSVLAGEKVRILNWSEVWVMTEWRKVVWIGKSYLVMEKVRKVEIVSDCSCQAYSASWILASSLQ